MTCTFIKIGLNIPGELLQIFLLTHSNQVKLLNTFSIVLLMDNTYKTN